ncbi:MAG: ABC transporter permease [Planctomycetes bacterium]|nr:ABC transporter permease [Planctomycetota bacterium]
MSGPLAFSVQLVRLGTRSLLIHKLRSVLAVLGVVFGVGSVVSMLAIGEGASHEVEEQLRRLGPDRILLRSIHPPEGTAGSRKAALEYGLTSADLARLQALVPGIDTIAWTYEIPKEISLGYRNVPTPFVGTTPSFQEIHHLRISRGRFLTGLDMESRANVVVLGASVARDLFGAEDPVGRELRHASGPYKIVGVLHPKGGETAALHDPDRSSFIPLTTAKARLENVIRIASTGSRSYERVDLHQIAFRVRNLADVPQVASMVRRLLEPYHPQRDYQVMVPYELLRQAEHTKRVFSWVLGSIGGISLLVGGIGIMNIMLATVMERTREIGVRRALGAKRWHITLQFLVESVVLAASGGVLGMGLGLVVPKLVTHLSQMQTVITAGSLALSLLISVGVGIIFGVYPARRAALMDPIEALRHE